MTTRHYARRMLGGDTAVAERLDQARQTARAVALEAASETDLARIWHGGLTGTDGGRDPAEGQPL